MMSKHRASDPARRAGSLAKNARASSGLNANMAMPHTLFLCVQEERSSSKPADAARWLAIEPSAQVGARHHSCCPALL